VLNLTIHFGGNAFLFLTKHVDVVEHVHHLGLGCFVDGLRMAPNEENEKLVRGEDVMLVYVEGPHKIFMIKN